MMKILFLITLFIANLFAYDPKILTTGGDILTHDGTKEIRFPIGDSGYILSNNGSGLEWIEAGASISFGGEGEIPYTNSGSDDFDYDSNFKYDGSSLYLSQITAENGIQVESDAQSIDLIIDVSNGYGFFLGSGPDLEFRGLSTTFTPSQDSAAITIDDSSLSDSTELFSSTNVNLYKDGSLTGIKLGDLTDNGFVKTSGGDGTLSVDTNTYLTTLDAALTYLKLDTTNDPLSGNLEIYKNTPKFMLTNTGSNGKSTYFLVDDSNNIVEGVATVGQPAGTAYSSWNKDSDTDVLTASATAKVALLPGGTSVSYSIWFYHTAGSTTYRTIMSPNHLTTVFRILGSNDKMYIVAPGVNARLDSWGAISKDVWHHLVITISDTNIYMYLDATKATETMAHTGGYMSQTGNFYLNSTGQRMQGYFDEFNAWTTELSQADVTTLFNSGNGLYLTNQVQPASIVGAWHFNEGSGNTATDSINGHIFTGTSLEWSSTTKIPFPPLGVNATWFKAEDGTASGEKGIFTFGNSDGRTVLASGTGIYANNDLYFPDYDRSIYMGEVDDLLLANFDGADLYTTGDDTGSWLIDGFDSLYLSDLDVTTTGEISGGTITDGTATLTSGTLDTGHVQVAASSITLDDGGSGSTTISNDNQNLAVERDGGSGSFRLFDYPLEMSSSGEDSTFKIEISDDNVELQVDYDENGYEAKVVFEGSSGDIAFFGGGLVPAKVTADPCGTMQEGSIFYNDTSNYMCFCDGTNDVKLHDPSAACF